MHHATSTCFRRALLFLLPLLPFALLLSGCGGGDSNPINYQGNGRSGIRGTASVKYSDGTTLPYANGTIVATKMFCPGPGVGAPCRTINVLNVQTDAQGHFTLPLIAGQYGIAFQPASSLGYQIYAPTAPITVSVLQYTNADVTGIEISLPGDAGGVATPTTL